MCLIDSKPTLSFQNQGQDSIVAVASSDNGETSGNGEVPDVPNTVESFYDEGASEIPNFNIDG